MAKILEIDSCDRCPKYINTIGTCAIIRTPTYGNIPRNCPLPDAKSENCKTFCKLFAEAQQRDEYYIEKCKLCKEIGKVMESQYKSCSGVECKNCKSTNIEYKEDDTGYEDYHYRCKGCNYSWWVEGSDS